MKIRTGLCKNCHHTWIVRKEENGFIRCPKCQKGYGYKEVVTEVVL